MITGPTEQPLQDLDPRNNFNELIDQFQYGFELGLRGTEEIEPWSNVQKPGEPALLYFYNNWLMFERGHQMGAAVYNAITNAGD